MPDILHRVGIKSSVDETYKALATRDGLAVQQRVWPARNAQPIVLGGGVARRQLIGNTFLREDVEASPPASDAFTRVAYLNYNDVTRRYEYVSIDTPRGTGSNPSDVTLSTSQMR